MGFYILRSMSATLVAFLMVMCATPAGCSDPDPYGLVFNRNPLSWADAEAHCVSLGGHLASVSSEAMARHIDVNYVRGGGACHATWIGYNDRATEGDWVWTGAASIYTNWWQPTEPNDMDSGEDCASLGVDCIYGFSGVASGWADSGCSPGDYEYHARASICQVGVPALSRYSFHSSPKSWHAAREDCQSRGGDLASIHSEAENREAFALTGGRDTWLGLNGEEDEHNYVWSDGTPMDYHGWAPGEPNNYGGDEDCGGYWSGGNNGRWYDMFGGAGCSGELAYICNTAAPIGAPYDPDRGAGLPHCECNAYHNGAWQWMSRMCAKPWGDINVCYPTRVVYDWSQGTFLNGRYYDNRCDDGQSMCSPWTPPPIDSGSGSDSGSYSLIRITVNVTTGNYPRELGWFIKENQSPLWTGPVSYPGSMDASYHSYVQQATLFPSTFEYLFVITDSACDGIDIGGEHQGPPYDVTLTIYSGPNETPRPLFNYTISGDFGCYASILFECDQSPSDGNCDHWHVTDSVLHGTHTYPYDECYATWTCGTDDEEDSHEED